VDTLVVASNNNKKLKELREILVSLAPGLHLLSAADVGIHDIPETGTTFVENAILKAKCAYEHTGMVSLSDDSGLEVDALHGAPGVYSARYAGTPSNDANNNQKLLAALEGFSDEQRTARYRCVIALMAPLSEREILPDASVIQTSRGEALVLTFEGTCEGRVLRIASGGGGFGYDPYMLYPDAGLTFAQLTAEQKNAISHRGKALKQLAPHVSALFARVSLVRQS
jgi:XTP/dITP diphosphohydrolase